MDDPPPLYLRMYFQKHLTALVRLIGYDIVPVTEFKQRIKPLSDRFGKQLIREAVDEILDVSYDSQPATVRLTPHARKIAIGLLGRPPEEKLFPDCSKNSSGPSPVESLHDEPGTAEQNCELIQIRLSRNEVLVQYRDWLSRKVSDYAEVDRKRPMIADGVKLSTLDFVLRDGLNQLVTVRRYLTAKQRQHMIAWRKVYGTHYRAVRIWPVESENGWIWEEFPVDPPD